MQTEHLEEISILEALDQQYSIVLYNDEVNTFDHVIDCLIKYCDQTPEQAEQCSLLVHYKGQCTIMHGSNIRLKPICEALCNKDLSASIERN
jgi:ATP-dependent Clp protease adaptor protein ClpS